LITLATKKGAEAPLEIVVELETLQ
jgi:hypothetical protein